MALGATVDKTYSMNLNLVYSAKGLDCQCEFIFDIEENLWQKLVIVFGNNLLIVRL